MKKTILIMLFFLASVFMVNAQEQQDLINYFKNNDKISVKNTDLSYCSGKQEAGIYALPDNVKYPYTNSEIDKLQVELDNIKVNTKSKASVDSYNTKLSKIHNMVNANNDKLKEAGIPVEEYCKPYNCNKEFPTTVYQKSTEKCVCEDGKDFDKVENTCPITEIAPPVRENIDFTNDLDMQKGNLLLRIIGILFGLAVLYLIFRD